MMQGKSPNAAQPRFQDALVRIVGCIACRKMGHFNDFCTIHHIDGRSKPDSQWLVIPLCGPHHQTGAGGVPAFHVNKTRFEAEYGTQRELLALSLELLRKAGFAGPMSREGAMAA